MKIRSYPKYTAFCLGMLLVVILLSRFKGELYLSQNGYLLLKRSISIPNYISENSNERRTDTGTFQMNINGDRIYWMEWWDDFKVEPVDGHRVDRFFILSENYGMTEFHAWRTPEKLNYRIVNNIYQKEGTKPPEKYQKNMEMLAEYMAESFWYPEGWQVMHDHIRINQGRNKMTLFSLGLLLFLQCLSFYLLLSRWSKGQKYDKIKGNICICVFGILQLLTLSMLLSKYVFILQ